MTQGNLRPQRKASPFSIAVGIIAVIAVALLSAAGVFTDLLWFRQLGFETIFVTEIVAQIVTFSNIKAKAALSAVLDDPQPARLLGLLSDAQTAPFAELPDTGVGLATESLLSSVFIASQSYGTRASTALIVQADGSRRMVERSFGPFGGHLGEVEIRI